MPASIPIGMAIMDDMATMMILPTRALLIPPPGSPTGAGTLVKKCQFTCITPCLMIYTSITISGIVIINANNIMIHLNTTLFVFLILIRASILSVIGVFCNYSFADEIDDDGDEKQHQPKLDQRR